MYTRCLFCAGDLGRNEAIEAFPVGARLAFDAANGRLWVVCPRCARWNLTPLEERWEAIEEAERLYRSARRRVSTDQVGLARVADGTDLVRVGAALRPEFAAWRYGRQFAARRVRYAGLAAVGGSAAVGLAAGGIVVPWIAAGLLPVGGGVLGMIAVMTVAGRVYNAVAGRVASALDVALRVNADRVVAWLPRSTDGGRTPVTYRHLAAVRVGMGPAGVLAATVAHEFGEQRYVGDEAHAVLSALLPHVNRAGATRADVQHAVRAIETRGGPDDYVRMLARHASRPAGARTLAGHATAIPDLADTQRLALEMALHEEAERRAMDGELAALECAWRDAEELASLADGLALPSRVERAFARLRGQGGGPAG